MIVELFGRKIINFVTPFKRAFITIERGNQRTLTLPSVRSAVFFLNNGDEIYLDNIDELEKLCYIDYDIINEKDKNFTKYVDDFNVFKEMVKSDISNKGYHQLIINKRIIFSNVLHIICFSKTE